MGGGIYIVYLFNFFGFMMQMSNVVFNQVVDIGKDRLCDFLVNNEIVRQVFVVFVWQMGVDISLDWLDSWGKKVQDILDDDDIQRWFSGWSNWLGELGL